MTSVLSCFSHHQDQHHPRTGWRLRPVRHSARAVKIESSDRLVGVCGRFPVGAAGSLRATDACPSRICSRPTPIAQTRSLTSVPMRRPTPLSGNTYGPASSSGRRGYRRARRRGHNSLGSGGQLAGDPGPYGPGNRAAQWSRRHHPRGNRRHNKPLNPACPVNWPARRITGTPRCVGVRAR